MSGLRRSLGLSIASVRPSEDLRNMKMTVLIARLTPDARREHRYVEDFDPTSPMIAPIVDELKAKVLRDVPAILGEFLAACKAAVFAGGN